MRGFISLLYMFCRIFNDINGLKNPGKRLTNKVIGRKVVSKLWRK